MPEPLSQALAVVQAAQSAIASTGETVEGKKASSELGKAALTTMKFVNVCLTPLAVINFGYDKARVYFETKFAGDMAEKLADVPEEDLVEPKPSIAAPAINGLAFAHEEPRLRDLYLNLLKSSMNSRTAEDAHPAFVEVIKQINSEEARLLSGILQQVVPWPIIQIRVSKFDGKVYNLVRTHVLNMMNIETGEPFAVARLDLMVENWIRLGLVDVQYNEKLNDEGMYDWAPSRPELSHEKALRPDQDIVFQPGTLRVTPFGRTFANSVL